MTMARSKSPGCLALVDEMQKPIGSDMATKTGRPSDFTQETADIICERVADGVSLRKVCAADDTLPDRRTVLRWLAKDEHEEFRRQYARAQDERADFYFEETMEISDDVGAGRDDIAKARLRVDTRKWVCARMNPKKYSDRLAIDAQVSETRHEDALDALGGPDEPALGKPVIDAVAAVIDN